MTDSAPPSSPLAAFRGPVTCRSSGNTLTLAGAADGSGDDKLIVTFIAATAPEVPGSLGAATVCALDEDHYRIAAGSQDWTVAATSVHVHRDVSGTFYRAIPPRAVPLGKRLFWRTVLALAGTRTGKRLLLSVRRRT